MINPFIFNRCCISIGSTLQLLLKRRLKTLEGKVITKFTDKEIPKENTHYSCITAICIDSLIKLDKENYA